jgi:small-conductance mechanosensitive channel
MICGRMIPLTATSADDAWRFDAHSEDYLVFMSNAQILVLLLLLIAFNLLLCKLTLLLKLLQICALLKLWTVSVCVQILATANFACLFKQSISWRNICGNKKKPSILVLAVCLQKHMWNSGAGFHLSVAFFFCVHKSLPSQHFQLIRLHWPYW